MHCTAGEKHPLCFDAFLLTKVSQTNLSSLPMKKLNLNLMSLLYYDASDEKASLAARAQARTQRVDYAVRNHFSLGQGVASPALAAHRSPLSSTPREIRRLRKRASILRSQVDTKWALKTFSHKKRGPSYAHERYKLVTPV